MAITINSILQRNTDIISSEIDGETVMMDTNFEKYFGMRHVGTRIWQLMDSEISVREICEILTREYEVTEDQCINDILPFLQDLSDQDMIQQR